MGRGKLSAFELLPEACDGIVAWAASELSDRDRTQTDIYAEFVLKCEQLMQEYRGELEFAIPSFSAFNRYSMRLSRLTRLHDQTRDIVAAIAEKFDAKESDDLTIMTAETIKSLTLHMLADHGEKMLPKDVMQLASAMRQVSQAQNISTERRIKHAKQFAAEVNEAVDAVAKAKGMTAETSEAIKAQILGVRT
ncbi:phage protein Gp27 family protein [Yoonia sp.]|uniref:phage protein Gp27 family protein n=1 Tax=Yoonia sp. TaxID=2212373 RepID=UPI00391C3200